jgi:hypothetical protein
MAEAHAFDVLAFAAHPDDLAVSMGGTVVGVAFAEPFLARSPLLVASPMIFAPVRFR